LRLGSRPEYIGAAFGPNRLPAGVEGRVVAVLDFSFTPAKMEELLSLAKGVLVLDHHASAREALAAMPSENQVFAMDQSGATLAWDFFHGTSAPLLFRYIEDRDIWRWTLHRSRAFSAAQPLELPVPRPGLVRDPEAAFAPWKRVLSGGLEALDAMITRGVGIVAYQDDLVRLQSLSARKRRLKLAPEHTAYVVNGTVLQSELGNELAAKGVAEGVSFVIVARYSPLEQAGTGVWSLALRSEYGRLEGAADVAAIASLYGGGGHRAAAGMAVECCDLESIFVQEHQGMSWSAS